MYCQNLFHLRHIALLHASPAHEPRISCVLQYTSKHRCHAGASAAAWSCGDSVVITEVEVTARALAKAVAEAYSFAYANCKVDEGGFACASAGTSIRVWVEAVARAFAGAWALALQCDDRCFVDVDVVVSSVGTVLADAATDAYATLCGGMSRGSTVRLCIAFDKCIMSAITSC
jgi:hypothetical protein